MRAYTARRNAQLKEKVARATQGSVVIVHYPDGLKLDYTLSEEKNDMTLITNLLQLMQERDAVKQYEICPAETQST